jgi:hypothetical protein
MNRNYFQRECNISHVIHNKTINLFLWSTTNLQCGILASTQEKPTVSGPAKHTNGRSSALERKKKKKMKGFVAG